jgi:hypothetical protein
MNIINLKWPHQLVDCEHSPFAQLANRRMMASRLESHGCLRELRRSTLIVKLFELS